MRDEFLSEEDLDLQSLSREELILQWNQWLYQAQSTNDADRDTYSHGVFVRVSEPEQAISPTRVKDRGAKTFAGADGRRLSA